MENIRCVIANMPRELLGDIVERMIGQSGDIEVVDRIDGLRQLRMTLSREPVDLLVMGMQDIDLPESLVGILDDTPNLAIVGLVQDGRRLAAFADNVGADEIIQLIRSLCRPGAGSGS